MSLTFQSPAPPAPCRAGACRGPRRPGRSHPRLELTSVRPSGGTSPWPRRCPEPRSTTRSRPTRTRCCCARSPRPAAGSTSPARPRCGPRSRRAPRHPTSSTPTRSSGATTSPRHTPRGATLRRRLARRDRQGRRCRTRLVGARADRHLRRGVGLAAVAQVRLPDTRPVTCSWLPPTLGLDPAGRVVPRRLAAARPPRLGGADRLGRAGLRRPARRRARPVAARPGRRLPRPARRRAAAHRRLRPRHRHAPRDAFGADRPRTLAEPGRGVVGDAGTLVATVVGVVDRGGSRWVFLDAGVFTGLVETLDEAIRYRLGPPASPDPPGRACSPARPVTAPTCSTRRPGRAAAVPRRGRPGADPRRRGLHDRYSTVGFNGFAPLPTVVHC